MDQDFQIFISYARPDQQAAGELYEWLSQEGFNPWIDFKRIKGGQNWDFEIKRALDRSLIVVILWSENSRDHRGYIQRELKMALDKLQEKLPDDIFIVPIILSDTAGIPEQFKNIHCLSAMTPGYRQQLADSVAHQIERLGGERKRIQKDQDLYWTSTNLKEEWDGLPGYSVEIQIIEFASESYRNVTQITQFVRGSLLDNLFMARLNKLNQSLELHNYAQDKWSRTDTFDAICGEPVICGKMVTLNYMLSSYGAGAAHPVHGHLTFVFLLEPLTRIASLESIFAEPDAAFPLLQLQVREKLLQYDPWPEEQPIAAEKSGLEEQWINDGTQEWSHFSAFVFTQTTLDIYFASYQVAPYAAGTPHVSIPYDGLAKLMRREYVTALNIERHTYS